MTDEEYLTYMNKPLSDAEKQQLIDNGWEFSNENYIFISNDYDGCMASGIINIRRVLLHIQHRDLYNKHVPHIKNMLEELESNNVC